MITLKKITKLIVNAFTIILLILLALVIYGKVTTAGKNGYPNYFGYTFFEVASGSMEPTLQINDVILVKITKDNLKKGDIIAFSLENAIITHRIIYMDGDVLTVKGDNNNTIDKPIIVDNVIGKVIKIYPRLGVWKKVLAEPKILLLIFVTLLLFDFALSYDSKKNLQDDKKEIDKEMVAVEVPRKKDVIESDELLSLTRKIDVEEINKLLEENDSKNVEKELKKVKEEVKVVQSNGEEKVKEKKKLDYTVRLDLNEIHKKVDERMR